MIDSGFGHFFHDCCSEVMEEAIESSGHVGEDEIAAVNADAADVSEPVDLEDGELSDEDNNNESSTQDATAIDGTDPPN